MLITSLIFLLLSNSITLRRDKSILYSRATITILLISGFTAYNYLCLLTLWSKKEINIDMLYTTVTNNIFYIFIFLVSISLLTLLFLGKPLEESDIPHPKILRSGTNLSMLQIGTLSISIYYGDSLFNDIFFFYDTATDAYCNAYDYISNLAFETRPMHPSIAKIYAMYMAIHDNGINIRHLLHNYTTEQSFISFSPFRVSNDLGYYHTNIEISRCLRQLLFYLLGALLLIAGVNTHTLIAFCIKVLNIVKDFLSSIIKKCMNYDPVYEPVNRYVKNFINDSRSNLSRYVNIGANSSGSGSGGGNNGGGGGRRNLYNIIDRKYSLPRGTLWQLLCVILYVYFRVIQTRINGGHADSYGNLFRHDGNLNLIVTLSHIARYIIANPNEVLPFLNIRIDIVFTSQAKSRIKNTIPLFGYNDSQISEPLNVKGRNTYLFGTVFNNLHSLMRAFNRRDAIIELISRLGGGNRLSRPPIGPDVIGLIIDILSNIFF